MDEEKEKLIHYANYSYKKTFLFNLIYSILGRIKMSIEENNPLICVVANMEKKLIKEKRCSTQKQFRNCTNGLEGKKIIKKCFSPNASNLYLTKGEYFDFFLEEMIRKEESEKVIKDEIGNDV